MGKDTADTGVKSLTLDRLPSDLLMCVADFLPRYSRVALSLTSKNALKSLPLINLELGYPNLEQEKTDKHHLLDLLSRDLPDLIPCLYCSKLHDVNPSLNGRLAAGQQIRHCEKADLETGVSTFFGSGFGFTHFQMAMKLSEAGSDPSPYLSLVDTCKRTYSYKLGNITLTTTQAKVVDTTAFYRTQKWMLVPRSFLGRGRNRLVQIWNKSIEEFGTCRHMTGTMYRGLNGAILHQWEHFANSSPCQQCQEYSGCEFCETEFRLDTRDFGERGFAFVLTAWTDLGEAMTPRDPKWQNFINADDRSFQTIPKQGLSVGKFEGCAPADFVPQLTPEQEKILFSSL